MTVEKEGGAGETANAAAKARGGGRVSGGGGGRVDSEEATPSRPLYDLPFCL